MSLEAAQRAAHAARRTAEAAELASKAAARDVHDSDAALAGARDREEAAGAAFKAAQEQGFPKPLP